MISLRPMLGSEYPAFLDYFIPDYAADISANYGLSSLDALAHVKQEIANDLPHGVNTSGEVMLCVINHASDAESVVGYLWYRPDLATRSAFIKDFHIFAPQQGKGFGKQALNALEAELVRAAGFDRIKLRVAQDNKRAMHLYDVTGFRVTGINMSKTIKAKS